MTAPVAVTVQTGIDCPYDRAYAFLSDPANMAQWASGLGASLRAADGAWIADTPDGEVAVRFAVANAFGVLDHDVQRPTGEEVHVPMRVVPADDGCVVMLTLIRRPGMSDKAFNRDHDWIARDLATLKSLLEQTRPRLS